jgi:hypothetical protein
LKPFDPEKLLEMIEKLIKEKQNKYFQMFSEGEHAKKYADFQISKPRKMVEHALLAIIIFYF